jgi:hypothetical protein
LFKSSTGGSGALLDSLFLATVICIPLLALGALAIHVVKGKARRVAAFTGARAFLVLGNTHTGIEQLRTVDGYAAPFFPVVTVHRGNFEIWRGAEDERPITSIPLDAMTVEVGRQWAVYPHAAFELTIVGLEEPVSFSLYGDRWWSFLTMSGAALEETGQEIGLLRGRHGTESGDSAERVE